MNQSSSKAAFIDRDGVINELIWNPATSCYESPHHENDVRLISTAFEALLLLQKEYKIFVVSNQPSYAKGKTSLEEIHKISANIANSLLAQGIKIERFYYCYHHPHGIVPEYTKVCECRKPQPRFLLEAAKDFHLDLSQSWMIGDQDTDILCGQNVGCKTALILNKHSEAKRGETKPTLNANDLWSAAQKIHSQTKETP